MSEPVTGEHDRIQRGLAEWLERVWPNAGGLELSNFRAPEVGASAQTLFFDVRWNEQGRSQERSLVAHLKPRPEVQVFPDCDPAREYRIMSLLGKTDVAVPRMFGYEPDSSMIGSPFYLMERIEGRLFIENPPYHIQGWVADSTPQDREAMWLSGIDAFARVHRLDWKALGFGFLDRPDLGTNPLDQQMRYWKDYYRWILRPGDRHPLCEEAFDWLDSHRPRQPGAVTLCWGDAKVGNMVFRGTKWEMARLGNPVEDVVWYMILDRILWEGINFPRLPGFPSREDTLRHWEKVSGFAATDVEYYEVFGALKISLILYHIYNIHREHGAALPTPDWPVRNNATVILEKELASNR